MNKFYNLFFLILILIVGCKAEKIEENIVIQSVESLNMTIYSNDGKRLLTVKSPYSVFNKEKKIFNLKSTTINLFKDNKTEYVINSDKSKLSNNNNLIELIGNVIVKNYSKGQDKLYANSFTWSIQNSEYLLVGNVKYENDAITLSSNKAILNKDVNMIEFFNPVKYKIKDKNKEDIFEINSENAYYNFDTKSVSFSSRKERVRSKIYF